jgi:hypothetical protein
LDDHMIIVQKGGYACGPIGSTPNDMFPRNTNWLHG